MQQVDPFIPVRKHRSSHAPAGPYGTRFLKKPAVSRPPVTSVRTHPRVVDSVVPVAQAKKVRTIESPSKAPVSDTTRPVSQPKAKSARRSKRALKMVLMCISILILTVLAQDLELGEILVGIYAAFVLIRRIPSKKSFVLALISLLLIALLEILQQGQSTIAANVAVYAFLFLVIGTVSLGIELRSERV